MYIAGNTRVKYRLDVSEAVLQGAKLKDAFQEIKHINKGIALAGVSTIVETVVFPQQDYVNYSKLSPVGKRKMLRKMEKKIALKDMSYDQAKLFHRLKGRIG